MERNREARRGSMAAVNGGLSRRRQRSSSLRDSPEGDGGGAELHEGAARLRERASTSKKERDRERSSRSSKRRRDRVVHGGREEGEDSSEESIDDEEEDDYEEGMGVVPPQMVRSAPPAAALLMPHPNPSLQNMSPPNHQNHHHRKGIVAKIPRASIVWKVADEMIGVSVPRKARTASAKRSHECWVSGGGGGGAGAGGVGGVTVDAVVHRQPSTSPARPSPSSSAPISPSSSNASTRKKMKPSSGNKHRPPKILKPLSSSVQDIEFEVAEVLFGMTRQFPGPPKQDAHKLELKETLNGSSNEAKSRVSSPSTVSTLSVSTQLPLLPPPSIAPVPAVVAPKRKKPRPVKPEEEIPQSPPRVVSVSQSSKIDVERTTRVDGPCPTTKLEKMQMSTVVNGAAQPNELRLSSAALMLTDGKKEPLKIEVNVSSADTKASVTDVEAMEAADVKNRAEMKEEKAAVTKPASLDVDVKLDKSLEKKESEIMGSLGKEKFEIDLMAPPPGKASPEDEAMDELGTDYKTMVPEATDKKDEIRNMEERRDTAKPDPGGSVQESKMEARSTLEEIDSRKLGSKERTFDLLEISKQEKDESSNNTQQQSQKQMQQSKPKTDVKSEKPVQSGALPLPMNVAGWHGGLPPFGYMGQVPSLVPMDGNAGPAKPMPVMAPPQRPKRCATHCYIAQCIQYHQQLQQLSRVWPAASVTAFYGAKPQYNVNGLQSSESAVAILGNTLQGGGFQSRSISSLQDMGNPVVAASFGSLSIKDTNPAALKVPVDSSQRKQLVLQQTPQGVAANSMMGPAFVFPFNQQQAVAAAAALNRPGGPKSGNVSSIPAPSTSTTPGSSTAPASGTTTMNFNYSNLQETPYVAILQNNGYTFPIPAAHVGAPPPFRGNHPQAMPFFSNSFYTSQMLHPAQLHQQVLQPQQSQQPVPSAQQGHQNKSTSSGSSSSQKHQQRVLPGVSSASGSIPASHCLPAMKLPQPLATGRASEAETGSEEAPSSADSRVPSSHKGIYNHTFTLPVHPQNFVLMPTSDKQTHMLSSSQSSHSQAFTVSFPSLNGVTPPLGIDFSASQNHQLFQSIPEAARSGYQQMAAAAASQAAQQKKSEGKSAAETTEDERKTLLSSKAPVNLSQHSLAFASSSPSVSNSPMESSGRTLNLIQPPLSSSRSSNRPASAAPSSTTAGAAAVNTFSTHQQQQSHIVQQFQRQQQHQQQLLMQQQLVSRSKSTAPTTSNATLYTTSSVPKFPNTMGGFPQAVVVQGSASGAVATNQPNQWKNTTRSSAPVSIHSASQAPISSIKTQISQQQSRVQQPSLQNQTQISFSVAGNTQKIAPQPAQLLPGGNTTGNPSSQSSVLKGGGAGNGGGSGSPRSSTINKQGQPHSTGLSLPQQSQQSKSSPASSGHKSSPVTNRNGSSILGQPHIPQPLNSSSKQQMDQLQHFQQAQLYFSGAYMQPSVMQANNGHFQRQQQGPSQQPSSTSSGGMLSLCSSALTLGGATTTTDPDKSADPPPNMKNLPPQNLLQAAHLAAAAGGSTQRPLMSSPSFPYIHAVSSVSVKPPEQKSAAGNDNLHACWQPEKR